MGIDDVLVDLEKTAAEPNPTDIPPSDEMGDDGAPPPPPAESTEVPLAALKEERARRQELQNRIAMMETRFGQMMEGYNQLAQSRSQAQAAPPASESVDYEDAPLDYLKSQLEAVTSKLEALTGNAMQQQQRASLQEFQATVDRAEKAFAAQTPDYMDALAYIENRRTQELTALGYPPDAIKQIVTNDAAQLVQLALNQGKNPAEFAYNFAKTVGFVGKAAPPAAPPPMIAQGAVHEPPPSLGGMSSAPEGSAPSLQEISKLSDAEFNQVFKKYFPG